MTKHKKQLFFPKRIQEPKSMGELEMDVFENASMNSYKRWIIPLADDALNQNNLKTGTILDVGCGPGLLVKEFAKRSKNFRVTGVDIENYAIKQAKKNCKNLKNVGFKKASVFNLPFRDNHFNLVICKDSFHHFENPTKALNKMYRVIKRNGLLYIQDLRRDLPWYLLKQAIPPDTVFKKLQYYSARAAFTKEEIRKILSRLDIKHYKVKTRKITKKMGAFCKKIGVNPRQLKAAFQSRYVAIIRK